MAIYHFSAKLISRSTGRSAVAAAAYRAASRLHDERLGRHHDFTNKAGVVHSEVLLPASAPEHLGDRETLWNAVEAAEKRKDAQLAREVEFALPREMSQSDAIACARDFVTREFVARGMIADLNLHWDIGADGESKPHAHVLLTLREVLPDGFGLKRRDWNETALLAHWREAWAAHVNQRCAQLGIEAHIDHRTYEDQGVALEPQHKIGAAGARREAKGEQAERADEHRAIARRNGVAILADPAVGLESLTRTQATFTVRDLARFAHRHSDGHEQFDAVLAAMRHHASVIHLGKDGRNHHRFTTASMLSAEQALVRNAQKLAASSHKVGRADVALAIADGRIHGLALGREQSDALRHVTSRAGLSLVIGYAGSGKSAMLSVARDAWESAGFTVRGAALSGIAAENLEQGSGIASRTLASLEHGWAAGRDRLGPRDVLVIDEAGMIGTRQMQRVLAEASSAGAKVVLVGDVQQLQAIEAGAAFRLLAERHGAAEITEVRRQSLAWMREATRQFALGDVREALAAYAFADMVHGAPDRAAARIDLIHRWDAERTADPSASRIILTHTRKEAQMLNDAARQRRAEHNELGSAIVVQTERGPRAFAAEDRILFLRNERALGVKNGSLGTVETATPERLAVRLDDGRQVGVDLKTYAHVDHGYAATIHKAQGMTVERSHVLATPGLDAHSAYVALSRHRSGTSLHYGRDDFADQSALARALARERPKDMALDHGPSGRSPMHASTGDREQAGRRSVRDGHPGAARDERALALRSIVAARSHVAKPAADAMRAAVERAVRAVSGRGGPAPDPAPGRGRSSDRGAER